MIIGNGLIASAFIPYFVEDPDVIVFASGVSNSKELRKEEFLREREMLIEALRRGKLILYFSTCSINDPELAESAYVLHKIDMENLVRTSKHFAIFRISQVVGKTPNPNTLTNYLYRQIVAGSKFHVWLHAKRNLIDADDMVSIVTHLVKSKQSHRVTTNIASPFSISIPYLVSIFEVVLEKKANYDVVDAGASYSIDSRLAMSVANKAGVFFDENYIEKLVRKYYAK